MSPDPEGPLSAQVLLADRGEATVVAEFFGAAGFSTGPVVGTSFAISATRERFAATLGAEGADLAAAGEPAELPLEELPGEVASAIEAVAVQGPPDFGVGRG
ncbi:MAG TPA: hypothetical protein VFY37_12940 [Solirubrobacterales bacterium]|nr:hypothetical protein [Solirubrobacterales bacterium]